MSASSRILGFSSKHLRDSSRIQSFLVAKRSIVPKRSFSKQADVATSEATTVELPTQYQLKRVFMNNALPFMGFGFFDQTIMILAGNAIDCTLGVTLGLSTLTAAAFGLACSNTAGIVFGGVLERLAKKYAGLGAPSHLSNLQLKLPVVKRTRLAGQVFGIVLGCTVGLVNLLFIDTSRTSELKLQTVRSHSIDGKQQEYEITASNSARSDTTTLKVTGPDVDGLLASMTAALAVRNCSLVEMHAEYLPTEQVEGKLAPKMLEDSFYVINRETGKPFEDDELEGLAQGLSDSISRPQMKVSATIIQGKI